MAVAGTTLSTLTHLLKTRYIDRVKWAFKRKHVTLAHMRRQTRDMSGNTFTHPVMTAETQGIGAGAETADLPTPGYTSGINPSWSPRPHRGRIRVYEQSRHATKDNKGSFLRAWATEVDSLVRRFMKDINIEIHGDGRGGLAYLPAADDDTTVTVAGHQGPAAGHCVRKGMILDLIDATDDATALSSANTITARTSNTVTCTLIAGSDADDYWVRSGSLGYAFDGLKSIVDTSDPALANFGGLDRDAAANDDWKGQVKDFDDSFSLDLMDIAFDKVLDNTDYVPNFGVTRRNIQRLIARTLFEQMRFRPGDKTDAKPWKAVWFGEVPIYADVHCWKDHLYFLSLPTFEFMQVDDPHWMSFDGAIPHRVTDKAAYEASYLWHAIFASHMPNANVRCYDVKDPT